MGNTQGAAYSKPAKYLSFIQPYGPNGRLEITGNSQTVHICYRNNFSADELLSYDGSFSTRNFNAAMRQLQRTGRATVEGDSSKLEIEVLGKQILEISLQQVGGRVINIADVVRDPKELMVR